MLLKSDVLTKTEHVYNHSKANVIVFRMDINLYFQVISYNHQKETNSILEKITSYIFIQLTILKFSSIPYKQK